MAYESRRSYFWSNVWRILFDVLLWLFLPTWRDLALHRAARAGTPTDVLHLERDKAMRAHSERISRHPNYYGGAMVLPDYAF